MSALPLNTIEIVVNVEIVRKIIPRNLKTNRDAYAGLIEEPLSIDGSSWVAVRCFEDRQDGQVRFAHSGPFRMLRPSTRKRNFAAWEEPVCRAISRSEQ